MRKAKVTSDIAVMELSQSSLGVKTRAKTLALQKLEAANSIRDSSCYLQLRNRRLEKTNDAVKTQKSGGKESFKHNPDGNFKDLEGKSRRLNSGHVGSESGRRGNSEKGFENGRIEEVGCFDLGVEASFGENNLEFDARERYQFFIFLIDYICMYVLYSYIFVYACQLSCHFMLFLLYLSTKFNFFLCVGLIFHLKNDIFIWIW